MRTTAMFVAPFAADRRLSTAPIGVIYFAHKRDEPKAPISLACHMLNSTFIWQRELLEVNIDAQRRCKASLEGGITQC